MMDTETMANGVRKYQPEDRHRVEDICYQTGFMGEPADFYWPHKPSFVDMWTSYYLDGEPESTLVAVMEDRVVGYLTGCVDTSKAPTYEQLLKRIIRRHRLLLRPNMTGFFLLGLVDAIRDGRFPSVELDDARWPAHLHINLLPEARGTGLGRLLMQTWQAHVQALGLPGCHLGTIAENVRAIEFFEKMGFQKHGPATLIPGQRGRDGKRLHDQVMVWSARSVDQGVM